MMIYKNLLYKRWLETRFRFLTSAILLFFIIIYSVFRADTIIHDYTSAHPGTQMLYSEYVWVGLYNSYMLSIFILAAFTLGMGGLWNEKIRGTSPYTLSLPVSRKAHIYSDVVVAFLQIFLLVIFICTLIILLSAISGNNYPVSQAVRFAFLELIGGMIFAGFGMFLSAITNKELTALTWGLSAMIVVYFIFRLPYLMHANIFYFMAGSGYLDENTLFFERPLNWPGAVICLFVFVLIVAVISRVIDKKDF